MRYDGPWLFFGASNLLTYTSILSGFCAVLQASRLELHLAGLLLGISVIADVLDGKFANLFTRSGDQRAFGAQIDTLADALAFCAAPPLISIFVAEKASTWALVASGLVYVFCGLTRLGYYNIRAATTRDFVGVPTTLLGLVWLYVFLLPIYPALHMSVGVAGGVLMVAPIRVPRPGAVGVLALSVVAGIGVALHYAAR